MRSFVIVEDEVAPESISHMRSGLWPSLGGRPLSSTTPDPLHSEEEERLIIIGQSIQRRLLVVVHTDRGDNIRIISARVANAHERRTYGETS